jgi:hypothetical protein
MLMQLVLASRNYIFYFGTEKALSDVDFLNSIQFHYPPEDSVRLVSLYPSNKKMTIFPFIQTAFSLSNAVYQHDEEILEASFFDQKDEAIDKIENFYGIVPETFRIQDSLLFLKVHRDVCLCCREKLEEYKKDYLTTFGKFDYYEQVIDAYIDNNLSLSNHLLVLFFVPYRGRNDPDTGLMHIMVDEEDDRLRCSSIIVEKVDLFKIATSFGLVKLFKRLKLGDEQYFNENLKYISQYAVDGGNLEIIRICEQEDSQVRCNHPDHPDETCCCIADRNATMNILCWLLGEFPKSAVPYSLAFTTLVNHFYDSPITVSKTCFLLNILQRYCPAPTNDNFDIKRFYRETIVQNIVPIIRYLVETKIISSTRVLSEALLEIPYSALLNPSSFEKVLLNVDTVKYLIEQGADPCVKFTKYLRAPRIEYETNLLQLALANNDLEFAQFLRDETDRRLQLAEVKEEM